jgi:hypothetical protein
VGGGQAEDVDAVRVARLGGGGCKVPSLILGYVVPTLRSILNQIRSVMGIVW